MAVLSLPQRITIDATCMEYVHPWTDSCVDGSLALLLHAFPYCIKTYFPVYMATLLMKRKKINKKVIRQTLQGILQSSIFLTTHSYGFSITLCTMRLLSGNFDKYSVAFTPAFLSSLVAIHLERPSRRPLLCLYVSNVATETLFRMAKSRGWVRSIKNGQVIIFSLSTAAMLYLFRSDPEIQDSMFSIIRYLVGPHEQAKNLENAAQTNVPRERTEDSRGTKKFPFAVRSPHCQHPHSCGYFTLQGLAKMMVAGYGIQVGLRLFVSLKKIVKNPSSIKGVFYGEKVFNLGAFLGLFSGIYRGTSCALRWIRKCDSEYHAIPASLLAGTSFIFYPDTTAALYIMWKALQLLYIKLIKAGCLPEVPFGTILLYSFSTAILFHAALLEPHNLRPSYYKFLYALSGGRIAAMDRLPLDKFLLETSKNHDRVCQSLGLVKKLPFPFEFFGNAIHNY